MSFTENLALPAVNVQIPHYARLEMQANYKRIIVGNSTRHLVDIPIFRDLRKLATFEVDYPTVYNFVKEMVDKLMKKRMPIRTKRQLKKLSDLLENNHRRAYHGGTVQSFSPEY